jgi:PIN domain nuclease of toxin-antitoxin system
VEAFRSAACQREPVKLLLDTNVLIWWLEDDLRLGRGARALIADSGSAPIASVVSIWEITMKWRAAKYRNSGSVFMAFLHEESVPILGLEPAHLERLENVGAHHKDPFDHLLIAQAMVEGARIVTSDREMTRYGVPCYPAAR